LFNLWAENLFESRPVHPFVQACIAVFFALVVLGPAEVMVEPAALIIAPDVAGAAQDVHSDAEGPFVAKAQGVVRVKQRTVAAVDQMIPLSGQSLIALRSPTTIRVKIHVEKGFENLKPLAERLDVVRPNIVAQVGRVGRLKPVRATEYGRDPMFGLWQVDAPLGALAS
jgi:hypothetical protein